jgi:hypothetical protein
MVGSKGIAYIRVDHSIITVRSKSHSGTLTKPHDELGNLVGESWNRHDHGHPVMGKMI